MIPSQGGTKLPEALILIPSSSRKSGKGFLADIDSTERRVHGQESLVVLQVTYLLLLFSQMGRYAACEVIHLVSYHTESELHSIAISISGSARRDRFTILFPRPESSTSHVGTSL